MDIILRYNMSLTKKEKAINPNARCPAILAKFILHVVVNSFYIKVRFNIIIRIFFCNSGSMAICC